MGNNKLTDYYRAGGIGGIKLGRPEGVDEIPWDIQRSICANPSKKLIYYKPGKAAGTSIFRHILQPMGGWIIQKDNPKEFSQWIESITDDEMDKYFKFIFVRNPFARLVSFWNDYKERVPFNSDFKEHVKNKNNFFKDDIPTLLHHQTQSSLIESPDGSKSNLNFIGKVENIDEDWKTLCSMANIPYVPMVQSQAKSHAHHASFYDKETAKIVADMYERDFEMFGYSKKLRKGRKNG
jgi:hypothetical protein